MKNFAIWFTGFWMLAATLPTLSYRPVNEGYRPVNEGYRPVNEGYRPVNEG